MLLGDDAAQPARAKALLSKAQQFTAPITVMLELVWVLEANGVEPTALADGLERWWGERKAVHAGVRRLHIELDNGPEVGSSRTQFLKRLVAFVDRHRVAVELVYLPPYHSKYNPIERCWGILERHWNGALLSSVADVLRWAGTMTWRGLGPIVRETATVYERGVRLTKAAFRTIATRLTRSATLPKWSLTIQPKEPGD